MSQFNLSNAIGIMDDIELNPEEIDEIHDKLLNAIKNMGKKGSDSLTERINEFTKGKDDISQEEIFNWISGEINPDILIELQKVISDDKNLLDLIQNMFFEKMFD